MGKPKYAARVDENQPRIVNGLRGIPGVTVQTGMDDLLVGYKGKTYWIEMKSGRATSKRTGKVLESEKKVSQKKLEAEWAGHYAICSSLEEILTEIGAGGIA